MNITKRRSFFKKAAGWLLTITGLLSFRSSSKAAAPKTETIKGSFLHIVFFWLKEPGNVSDRQKFEGELKAFIDNTPGIRSKHIGTPANTSRPVIDSTYCYSLVLSFDSKKEHDAYQEHPLHKTFIENAGPLWEKVQVYDSELM